MQRRQAYHEYELDSSEAMGVSRKCIRLQTQAHWKAAGTQERDAWAFLRMVRERLYDMSQRQGAVKVRTRIPTPLGVVLPNTSLAPVAAPASAVVICKGIGMMRTFNTGWHNELPDLARIMSDATLSTENKIKAMQNVPALQTKFRRYEEHVQALAKQFRLPTWGCSFEVSLNAAAVGRVHCHDYIGPAIDNLAGQDSVRRVIEFTENDRVWDGMRGHFLPTSARGNMQPGRVKSIIGVLYYVISNKTGSLFCSASKFHSRTRSVGKSVRSSVACGVYLVGQSRRILAWHSAHHAWRKFLRLQSIGARSVLQSSKVGRCAGYSC